MKFKELLEKIKNNDPSTAVVNLYDSIIGNEELKKLGETLKNNDKVWSIQLPRRNYSQITDAGLESFEKDIKLREKPLTVECNNTSHWRWRFDIINNSPYAFGNNLRKFCSSIMAA